MANDYDHLLEEGDRLEIIDDHHCKIIDDEDTEYYFYHDNFAKYSLKLHRKDGAAIIHTNGRKKYYWMGSTTECSSDEEWQGLIRFNGFWG